MRACIQPASRARACIIGQILYPLRSDHALYMHAFHSPVPIGAGFTDNVFCDASVYMYLLMRIFGGQLVSDRECIVCSLTDAYFLLVPTSAITASTRQAARVTRHGRAARLRVSRCTRHHAPIYRAHAADGARMRGARYEVRGPAADETSAAAQ